MEKDHTYKREKYPNLTKELRDAGYKVFVMLVEVGARGFIGSPVYDLLTKLSICGNKRTKALTLPVEIAENSSRWIWSRRNESSIRDALTIGSAVKKWFSDWTNNPQHDEGVGSNPALCEEKIAGRHQGNTWKCDPVPLECQKLRAEIRRNTRYEEAFFSEDSLLFDFLVSFFILTASSAWI